MKKLLSITAAVCLFGLPLAVRATPSTEFWTAGTTDIQAFGIGHLDIDDYFHITKTSGEARDEFPTDVGCTVGILPWSKVQMEVGIDLMGASNFPVMFNTKLATPEDGFFKGQPALAVGAL